jgi:3'(2'), 5'-bisphosphate nucleotidase
MLDVHDHRALTAMIDAVRAASRICRAVQADRVSAGTLRKDDRSPVTVADFASQAIVAARLRDAHPGTPLVAEEDSSDLRLDANAAVRAAVADRVRSEWPDADETAVLEAIDRGGADPSERFFVLDPIDGTKGFLRGDQYAVALGLIEDGEVVAGVLGGPNLPLGNGTGCVFAAVRADGAAVLPLDDTTAPPAAIRVSAESDPARARFCESVEKAHTKKGRSAEVARLLGVAAEPVAIDSQCKYALVARGDAELYLRLPSSEEYRERIWDHAAGLLVVEEAGGRVTDIHGRPLDFRHGRRLEENRGVVASNGTIHDAVIAAISRTG